MQPRRHKRVILDYSPRSEFPPFLTYSPPQRPSTDRILTTRTPHCGCPRAMADCRPRVGPVAQTWNLSELGNTIFQGAGEPGLPQALPPVSHRSTGSIADARQRRLCASAAYKVADHRQWHRVLLKPPTVPWRPFTAEQGLIHVLQLWCKMDIVPCETGHWTV